MFKNNCIQESDFLLRSILPLRERVTRWRLEYHVTRQSRAEEASSKRGQTLFLQDTASWYPSHLKSVKSERNKMWVGGRRLLTRRKLFHKRGVTRTWEISNLLSGGGKLCCPIALLSHASLHVHFLYNPGCMTCTEDESVASGT